MPKKKMSLPVKVMIGAFLGMATGIFLGDYASIFQPIGSIYIMLLEAAVYPYIISALLHGLGTLSSKRALLLFRSAWPFFLLAWGITFTVLIIFASAIPPTPIITINPPSSILGNISSVLQLIIPENIFTALTKNYVPAVTIFCLLYGIAMQAIPEKSKILDILDIIRTTSLNFWKWVVKFVPYAVFALFASAAGTIKIANLTDIFIYLVLVWIAACLLIFWLFPSIIANLAGLKHGEILREMRDALTITIVTTLSVVALPYITEITRRVAIAKRIDDPDRDEIIQTNLSITYVLGQMGNYFVYLFIIFAARYYHHALTIGEHITLPGFTLLSCMGSPTATVNAVSFLQQWLHLSPDTTSLYIELMTITRYPQVTVTAAAFAFLSILVTLNYYGKLVKLRWPRMLAHLGGAIVLLLLCSWGIRAIKTYISPATSNPYLSYTLPQKLTDQVEAKTYHNGEKLSERDKTLLSKRLFPSDILSAGALIVGYNAGVMPFSYFNKKGQLVGLDIEFAYELAQALNVRLIFLPFKWKSLLHDLENNRFDIAVSGIYITPGRLEKISSSLPYFVCSLALFGPTNEVKKMSSQKEISKIEKPHIGIYDDPALIKKLKKTFPNAEFVVVPSYIKLPDFSRINAALWTEIQARAIAASHPGISAVALKNTFHPFLFGYLMPKASYDLRHWVNYLINLHLKEGDSYPAYRYWILLKPRKNKKPRWSVMHNVLGWT